MQGDFHYYATYCAALLAGYTPAESTEICYSAQMADWCTRTFLSKLHAPLSAATTQSPIELAEARTDPIGLQDITRSTFYRATCTQRFPKAAETIAKNTA